MKKYTLAVTFLMLCAGACAQNKSFTFVFLNNKPDKEVLSKEKSDSIMTGHMNNIGRLAKEGKLLAAGPFEGGGGIFILNTTSIDEANQWLSTDPGVKAKRWNLEVLPYTVTLGSICPVGEKFEMVFYQFVRFASETVLTPVEKDSFHLLNKTNAVIHAGFFGETKGGIVIVKPDVVIPSTTGEVSKSNLETKKLYIAKGSFCEK
jgi:uncharacterized protein YciI